jgi:hypothetical protein
MVMSRNQNAERSHNIKIDKFLLKGERVQIFINNLNRTKLYQGRIKNGLKLGNVGYHSAQNLLSSSLLSKNIKMRCCTANTREKLLLTQTVSY